MLARPPRPGPIVDPSDPLIWLGLGMMLAGAAILGTVAAQLYG